MTIDSVPSPGDPASYLAGDYPVPDEAAAQFAAATKESMDFTDEVSGGTGAMVRYTLASGRRFLVTIGDITDAGDADPFAWPAEAEPVPTIDPDAAAEVLDVT